MDYRDNAGYGSIRQYEYSSRGGESRGWSPLDLILVLLLTLAAALMAFTDLGNRSAAQTFWMPGKAGESFVVDFGEIRKVDRMSLYEGPGAKGESKIEWSADGSKWELYSKVEHKTNRVFTWKPEDKTVEARYMRFTAERIGFRLYEGAFFTKEAKDVPIPVAAIRMDEATVSPLSEGNGYQVFDEQQYAPYTPDYRNSMYFDEIYHGRTAYEFVEGIEPYENTHPPLGKIVLALGVKLFGMTPYGWRFMAGVVGTLMVPIFYAVARSMFRRTRYAFLATLLLVLEGFHIVHSRSANVDITGVTFTIVMYFAMYKYGETAWQRGGFKRGIGWLALSGAFFGAAASVKWNYMYGGAGLALLLLFALIRRYGEARRHGDDFLKRFVLTIMACVVLFVAVPVSIYATTYIPYLKATKADDDYKDLWQYQKNMYNYHKGVKEPHPYASKWYTWPLMMRPVWYFGGKDLAPDTKQSIAAMGNPVVWYVGLLAMILSWWFGLRSRDRIVLMLAVAYASFYVPWMVAPRSITFLYHYFPMVPLLIFSLVWMFRWTEGRFSRGYRVTWSIMALAFAMCIWFYPVYVGITIDKTWMNVFIRVFPSWDF